MIGVNILVPGEDREYIDNKKSNSFRIISSGINWQTSKRFFAIETTEEEMTFLTLKYGKENVWKR